MDRGCRCSCSPTLHGFLRDGDAGGSSSARSSRPCGCRLPPETRRTIRNAGAAPLCSHAARTRPARVGCCSGSASAHQVCCSTSVGPAQRRAPPRMVVCLPPRERSGTACKSSCDESRVGARLFESPPAPGAVMQSGVRPDADTSSPVSMRAAGDRHRDMTACDVRSTQGPAGGCHSSLRVLGLPSPAHHGVLHTAASYISPRHGNSRITPRH